MSKLLLFDGNALLHRAFHALPPLTTKKGEPINAVYGLVSIMIKVYEELSPTHLAFAFDTKEPTFRNKLSEDYQANRPEVDTALVGQFDKARTTLSAFNISYFEKPGFEADDIIGTICKRLNDQSDIEVIVVTGDRDLLQLVNNKTKLFMPTGGTINGKMYGDYETFERIGVYPKNIVDYKALVGDPSDNYFGVSGIGPKTAINLINEFHSFKNIYQNIDKVPKKIGVKLEKDKDSAQLSYKLAKIDTDVPIDFDLDKLSKFSFDNPEGISLFEEYGFKTLTNRVKNTAKKKISENQGTLL